MASAAIATDDAPVTRDAPEGSRGVWVIFREGTRFVARKFFMATVFIFDANEEVLADTLPELRALLPAGLTNLGRADNDSENVVETWA